MFAELRDTFGALDIFVSNARNELPTLCEPPLFEPPLDITLDKWATAFDSQARALATGSVLDANRVRALLLQLTPAERASRGGAWSARSSPVITHRGATDFTRRRSCQQGTQAHQPRRSWASSLA